MLKLLPEVKSKLKPFAVEAIIFLLLVKLMSPTEFKFKSFEKSPVPTVFISKALFVSIVVVCVKLAVSFISVNLTFKSVSPVSNILELSICKGESGFVDKDTNIRTRRIERLSRERAIREGVKNRMEGLPTIPVARATDVRGKYKNTINQAFAKAADNNRIDMVISAYLAQRKKHNLDNTYGSAVSITDPYSDVS